MTLLVEIRRSPGIAAGWVGTTEEVRTVSATGGEKGSKLERHDLLPVVPIQELATHYGRGSQKYDDHNWTRGYDWSLSYAALQRHLTAFWGGEDIDPETGSKHVIAAAWHCLALSWFMDNMRQYDDRFKPPIVAYDRTWSDSDDRS